MTITIKITTILGQGLPLGSYQLASLITDDGTDYYKIVGKEETYVSLNDASQHPIPLDAVQLSDGTYINPENVFAGMSGEEYGSNKVYSTGSVKGMTHDQAMAYNSWFGIYGSSMTSV